MHIRSTLLLVLGAALASTACGGSKLPQYVDRISTAEVETEKTAPGATVDMKTDATDGGDNPLEAAMNVASAAASATGGVKVKDKFSEALTDDDIRTTVRTSVRDALGEGPPFRAVRDGESADATIVVDIYQYGIEREGSSPSFMATYDAEIRYSGQEVWSETVECEKGGFWEETDATVVESAGFVSVIDNMSNEEFRSMVENGFRSCSEQLVKKIREDASG